MDGTRSTLLSEITSWINEDSDSSSIFWLTAPPGAGKSAIAHTVARDASSETVIVVSFFFDRTVEQRNNHSLFVGTLVRDLAGYDRNYKAAVCGMLDRKRDLAYAHPLRQFEDLITHLATTFTSRVLIVVDALDECSGYSGDLATILCEKFPELPSSFRLFLTSRPEEPLTHRLKSCLHVHQKAIVLDEKNNHLDISHFIHQRLRGIASRYRLGDSWPGEKRYQALVSKAGGLFVWASLAMNYLAKDKLMQPDKKLDGIIRPHAHIAHIEGNMEALYVTVLETCDWNDTDFVDGYQLVVGAIIAAKEPLSSSALMSLLDDSTGITRNILGILSPLLIHAETDDTPVQLLHLTLHDFLTNPIHKNEKYFVDEVEKSCRLGFQSLRLLTHYLKDDIPGLGWSESSEYPWNYQCIPSFTVPDAVAYACRSWIDHITNITNEFQNECLDILEAFCPRLIPWLEVTTGIGRFPRFDELVSWATVCSQPTRNICSSTLTKSHISSEALLVTKVFIPPRTHIHRSCLVYVLGVTSTRWCR